MSELYNSIREKAAQLYPSDEKAQEEFVDGFMSKTANLLSDLKYSSTKVTRPDNGTMLSHSIADSFWGRGVGQAAGKALVGGLAAGAFAGVSAMAKAVTDHKLYNSFLTAFREVQTTNRVIKAADPKKAFDYAKTIFNFAPHVATDANLLSSVLSNAIHGEGIDPMTIRSLTELESRYAQSMGDSTFNPKTWM